MADDEKKMKAGLNEVFICRCCAKTFLDRNGKVPVAVEMHGVVVQKQKVVPHEKYPDDPELATIKWEDSLGNVRIPEQEAGECCANHMLLADSRHLRFRQEPDGRFHIIGAGPKE